MGAKALQLMEICTRSGGANDIPSSLVKVPLLRAPTNVNIHYKIRCMSARGKPSMRLIF